MSLLKGAQQNFKFIMIFLCWTVLRQSFPVSACLRFVPDVDEDDRIPYPWEEERPKENKFPWDSVGKDNCLCGDPRDSNLPPSWTALVEFEDDKPLEMKVVCGGTLINSRYVMTSFSCLLKEEEIRKKAEEVLNLTALFKKNLTEGLVIDSFPVPIKVEFNFQPVVDNEGDGLVKSFETNVVQILAHPGYAIDRIMKFQDTKDIALLRLEKEADFARVRPICLYPGPPVTQAVERGIRDTMDCYDVLKEIDTQDETNSLLQDCFSNRPVNLAPLRDCSVNNSTIASDLICSTDEFPETNGWALTSTLKTGQIAQIGIASWEGGNIGQYRFFTNVTGMLPFINYFAKTGKWCGVGQGGKEPPRQTSPKPPPVEQSSTTETTKPKTTEGKVPDITTTTVKTTTTTEKWVDPGTWERYKSKRNKKYVNYECGDRTIPQQTGRIAGGETAVKNEFKWQVLLYVKKQTDHDKYGLFGCGGSIINDRIILTAAHCVVQDFVLKNSPGENPVVKPDKVSAYLGAHSKDLTGSTKIRIQNVYSLDNYNVEKKKGYTDWDIALLETAVPIRFNKKRVMPICIPNATEAKTDKFKPEGKTAWLSGWGRTDPTKDGSSAKELQKIPLTVKTMKDCNDHVLLGCKKADKRDCHTVSEDRYICIGQFNRWKSSGPGDSGGPAAVIQDGKHYQVGIVSFGFYNPNNEDEKATFYVDVRKFLSYIDYYSDRIRAAWCPNKSKQGA